MSTVDWAETCGCLPLAVGSLIGRLRRLLRSVDLQFYKEAAGWLQWWVVQAVETLRLGDSSRTSHDRLDNSCVVQMGTHDNQRQRSEQVSFSRPVIA